MPGISATGRNTATIAMVVASTAKPISSAASIDAWYADLPMRMWRTMFSISTMASSTSTPATRLIARSDRKLRLMPSRLMNQKAGIADNGMAKAEIIVARKSRRKRKTTRTASTAPSIKAVIDESYCDLV